MKRVRIDNDEAKNLMDGDEARIVFWETQQQAMIDMITEKIKAKGFVESLTLYTEQKESKRKFYRITVLFMGELCLPGGAIEGNCKGGDQCDFAFGIKVWKEFLLGFMRFWGRIFDAIQPELLSVFKCEKVKDDSWGTPDSSAIGFHIRMFMPK